MSAYLHKRGIRKLQQIEVNGYADSNTHLETNICFTNQTSVHNHLRSVDGKARERKRRTETFGESFDESLLTEKLNSRQFQPAHLPSSCSSPLMSGLISSLDDSRAVTGISSISASYLYCKLELAPMAPMALGINRPSCNLLSYNSPRQPVSSCHPGRWNTCLLLKQHLRTGLEQPCLGSR